MREWKRELESEGLGDVVEEFRDYYEIKEGRRKREKIWIVINDREIEEEWNEWRGKRIRKIMEKYGYVWKGEVKVKEWRKRNLEGNGIFVKMSIVSEEVIKKLEERRKKRREERCKREWEVEN